MRVATAFAELHVTEARPDVAGGRSDLSLVRATDADLLTAARRAAAALTPGVEVQVLEQRLLLTGSLDEVEQARARSLTLTVRREVDGLTRWISVVVNLSFVVPSELQPW